MTFPQVRFQPPHGYLFHYYDSTCNITKTWVTLINMKGGICFELIYLLDKNLHKELWKQVANPIGEWSGFYHKKRRRCIISYCHIKLILMKSTTYYIRHISYVPFLYFSVFSNLKYKILTKNHRMILTNLQNQLKVDQICRYSTY